MIKPKITIAELETMRAISTIKKYAKLHDTVGRDFEKASRALDELLKVTSKGFLCDECNKIHDIYEVEPIVYK